VVPTNAHGGASSVQLLVLWVGVTNRGRAEVFVRHRLGLVTYQRGALDLVRPRGGLLEVLLVVLSELEHLLAGLVPHIVDAYQSRIFRLKELSEHLGYVLIVVPLESHRNNVFDRSLAVLCLEHRKWLDPADSNPRCLFKVGIPRRDKNALGRYTLDERLLVADGGHRLDALAIHLHIALVLHVPDVDVPQVGRLAIERDMLDLLAHVEFAHPIVDLKLGQRSRTHVVRVLEARHSRTHGDVRLHQP